MLNHEQIKKHAKQVYPNECCGIVLNNDVIVPCRNISDTPEKSFIIDSDQIKDYANENIVGFYHSHKEYEDFSLADIAFSEKLHKFCILYCVDSNQLKYYYPSGAIIPYVGRPFFVGTLDCFTLSQDFYKREFNINISDLKHSQRFNWRNWRSKETLAICGENNSIIKDHFINNDFVEIKKPGQKGDIILVKLPNIKFAVHVIIYLSNNMILHHVNEFSEIGNYNNVYKRLTTNVLRHKSLN